MPWGGGYGVVLVNRGSSCPYCRTQLTSFQRAQPRLTAGGIRVVSLSTDDEGAAGDLVEEAGLSFPVAHSADAHVVSTATGAFVDQDPGHLQSTGFLLDPRGMVVVSVYSSGAVGRLTVDEVLGVVQYLSAEG
jgi:peroxiredoxin